MLIGDDVTAGKRALRPSRRRLAPGGAFLLIVTSSVPTLFAQVGGPPPPPPQVDLTDLRAYVERFTGPNASDCGHHVLSRTTSPAGATDLQRALACAFGAAKDRRPFWAFKQDQGMDSFLFQGLLGTVDGTVYQFWYDSAPCGGPGCAGRFSLSRCDKPTVVVFRNGRTQFGCDDLKERAKAPPQPLIPRSPIPNPETVIPIRRAVPNPKSPTPDH